MNQIDKFLQENEIKAINKNPLLFQHRYRALVLGKSGTGKSYWVLKNIVLNKDSPFELVLWVAPQFSLDQDKLKSAKQLLKDKLFLIPDTKITDIKQIIDSKTKEQQILIVLDDLINTIDKTVQKFISDLFVSGRHKNISTIEILQQSFTKNNRQHRLNTNYFVLFDFPDKSEIKRLLQQIEPKNVNKLMEVYESGIKENGGKGCLIISSDVNQMKGGELLKYRVNNLDDAVIL